MKERYGLGAENSVFIHPDDETKINKVSLGLESAVKRKARFYVGNILAMLYPKNFPKIHQAIQSETGQTSTTIERIPLDEAAEIMRRFDTGLQPGFEVADNPIIQIHQQKIEALNKTFLKELEEIGFVHLDKNPSNWTFDEEGNAIYLDSVVGIRLRSADTLAKLKDKIKQIKDPTIKDRCLAYLKRYLEITGQSQVS